jgi:hypothetical protein
VLNTALNEILHVNKAYILFYEESPLTTLPNTKANN